LRVAILSCFYPYRGGISQSNASLVVELGKEHDVKAFNFKRQYPELLFPGKTQFVTSEDEDAVNVESVPVLDSINPFSWVSTVRQIRSWNPDVLVVRYWMSFFAPSLGFVTRRMRKHCKVIQIFDNVIPHEPRFFDSPLTKYFLGGGDGYVALCEAVSKDLLAFKPDARYTVIQLPLINHFKSKPDKEDARKKLGLDPEKKTLLFFGLIREYKGLDILLEAFAKLNDDYQLVIAGEPYGSFDKYDAIIKRIGCSDRVHLFPEYIRDSEVPTYFAAADVCVLPYRSATQSGVSTISYHFEVPMIVTAVGGLKETIGDRGTGLVATDCTPEAILVEIERFFSDPVLRENCIENIRKEKRRLSPANFCRQLTDFAANLKK